MAMVVRSKSFDPDALNRKHSLSWVLYSRFMLIPLKFLVSFFPVRVLVVFLVDFVSGTDR